VYARAHACGFQDLLSIIACGALRRCNAGRWRLPAAFNFSSHDAPSAEMRTLSAANPDAHKSNCA